MTALTTSLSYDFATGLLTSSTDANNVTSTTEYNDSLERPTRVVRAAGTSIQSQTTTVYDDVARTVTTTSDLNSFNDNVLTGQTIYDGFGRVGEHISSWEAATLADGVRHLQHRFHGLYVIRPSHNAVRALDLDGAYDEQSDRIQPVEELMERGYEDAYRQFIEPVLGASGERMTLEARG